MEIMRAARQFQPARTPSKAWKNQRALVPTERVANRDRVLRDKVAAILLV
jgi:hypothetical protein